MGGTCFIATYNDEDIAKCVDMAQVGLSDCAALELCAW